MNIYILVDGSDHEEYAQAFTEAVCRWIKEGQSNVQLLDMKQLPDASAKPWELPHWDLGITFATSKKAKLKRPLEFLNALAEKLELDFVIGSENIDTGERENICYFGFEEGSPAPHEVASYLGLTRWSVAMRCIQCHFVRYETNVIFRPC